MYAVSKIRPRAVRTFGVPILAVFSFSAARGTRRWTQMKRAFSVSALICVICGFDQHWRLPAAMRMLRLAMKRRLKGR